MGVILGVEVVFASSSSMMESAFPIMGIFRVGETDMVFSYE